MSDLNCCENDQVNKNTPLPTCTPLPSRHEELTVDSIQITYDISDKRNEYYHRKDEKKLAKFLQTVLFSITILLFGLQMPTPSAFRYGIREGYFMFALQSWDYAFTGPEFLRRLPLNN